jgi:uncharacterized membrane protein
VNIGYWLVIGVVLLWISVWCLVTLAEQIKRRWPMTYSRLSDICMGLVMIMVFLSLPILAVVFLWSVNNLIRMCCGCL